MDVAALLEMDPALFICGVNHCREKHTRAGVDLVAACGMDAQILMQRLQILFGCAMLCAIHREHAASGAATERCMIGVMIEDDNITGCGF